MSAPIPYEIMLLRYLNGEDVPTNIGGLFMEYLCDEGFVQETRIPGGVQFVITDKGRSALSQPTPMEKT